MAQTHWEIEQGPFHPHCRVPPMHHSADDQEAQARLEFLVAGRYRLGLLVGQRGAGKSLQLERFADRTRRRGDAVVLIRLTGLGPEEIVEQAAAQLGLNPAPDAPLRRLWRTLTDRLRSLRYEGRRGVLLLDDADQAVPGTMMQVLRLLQTPGAEDAVTMVLGAHPETLHRVGRHLLELVDLRIDVASWSVDDTERHLRHALERTGRDEPVFAQEAIVRLHQLGHGVPRFINRLADLALVAHAGRDLEHIDSQTVESVFNELGTLEE